MQTGYHFAAAHVFQSGRWGGTDQDRCLHDQRRAGVRFFAARIGVRITNSALRLELDTITAATLGGTLLIGREGGTIIGVLLIWFMFNLFNLDASMNPFLRKVVRGLLLTLVVALPSSLSRRNR